MLRIFARRCLPSLSSTASLCRSSSPFSSTSALVTPLDCNEFSSNVDIVANMAVDALDRLPCCVFDNFLPKDEFPPDKVREQADLVLNTTGVQAPTRKFLWFNIMRGDMISLVKMDGNDLQAATPLITKVLKRIDGVRTYMQLAPTEEEVQLGLYPGKGERYHRHMDSHRSLDVHSHRTVTMVLYLTPPAWDIKKFGGALRVHYRGEKADVAPIWNRLVIFRSILPHEVRPCYAKRMALACWFPKGNFVEADIMD